MMPVYDMLIIQANTGIEPVFFFMENRALFGIPYFADLFQLPVAASTVQIHLYTSACCVCAPAHISSEFKVISRHDFKMEVLRSFKDFQISAALF